MVFETYRNQERQTALFNRSATQLPTIGVDDFALACDLVKDVNGHPSWNGDFSFLKQLAPKNGLICWGGHQSNDTVFHSFVDADHVHRINVSDQAKLFKPRWYSRRRSQFDCCHISRLR